MRRLATLVVVAVAAVGCTKGGEAGPAGSQGPSGVLANFASAGYMGSVVIPASFGFVYGCKTPAYTAGANERALLFAQGSCTSVPAGSGLGIRPGFNIDGTTDTTVGSWHYQQNTGAAAGGLSNSQVGELDLTAGTPYIFSVGLVNSNSSTTYTSGCYCSLIVIIAK